MQIFYLIVIVEEAAEVLESHIICSLTADCQHLIMIGEYCIEDHLKLKMIHSSFSNLGDHQQLRPSVNVHQLATKYHLNVSLFERLIMGGMKAVRLGVQHRMRPEIARLIVPAVYAQLENHSSVYGHPHIPGMQNDVIKNFSYEDFRSLTALSFSGIFLSSQSSGEGRRQQFLQSE